MFGQMLFDSFYFVISKLTNFFVNLTKNIKMKLRSGRYKWLTRPISINETIPNEILEIILLKLPTKDLLQCLSVSKLWKAFASPICRRRHVAAKLRSVFHNGCETEAFYGTFQRTMDLPWSACDLIRTIDREPLHIEQFKRFVDTFGPHIRKLKMTESTLDPDLLISALMQMPNLEILISEIDQFAKDIPKSCSENRLAFGKLKHLEILISSVIDIQLVEFICTNARRLQSVLVNFNVQYYGGPRQAHLHRLIATISGIRSIAFNILYTFDAVDLFQTLTKPELNVKEFEFKFPGEDVDDQYYEVLEQFLVGNSNCLEKLKINSLRERATAGPLRIPNLPKLNELEIPLRHVSSTNCHIQPFTANQFPSLKKITVRVPEQEDDGIDQIPIFDTAHFDSVQELTLHTILIFDFESFNKSANPMSTDWMRVFPNLVTLDLKSVTVESYPYIYERMSQLEHLSLRVHLSAVSDGGCCRFYRGDANSILCQYPKDTKKKNRGTVAQTQSLASLTNLKTLTLDFHLCDDIPDSKVHLALLKLHRLDCLTFQNIEISSEVKEKLGEYHGNVEVQPSFRNYYNQQKRN